jgi:membrane protease YdiL (CAAX protease family)
MAEETVGERVQTDMSRGTPHIDRNHGPRAGRLTTIVAWAFVLVGTIIPVVVAREALGGEPAWLVPAQATLLAGFLVATLLLDSLRELRVFALVLIVAGAQFLVDWSTVGDALDVGVTIGFWAWAADRTLSFLFSAALLFVLLVAGYGRDALFLRRGDLSVDLEPSVLPGLGTRRPWRWYAPQWGGGIVLATLVVSVLQGGDFWLVALEAGGLAVAVPVIILMATLNAVSEEFRFRAAPLGDLRTALGKRQALLLMAVVFGGAHFYGTPGGVPGVAMNAFLGWFLGKSMYETRGIGFALGLHFLLDIVVFSVA